MREKPVAPSFSTRRHTAEIILARSDVRQLFNQDMVLLILRGVKNILRNPCVRDGGTPLADFLSQKSFWIWVCSGLWRPPLYGPGRKKTFDTLLFFDFGYHH